MTFISWGEEESCLYLKILNPAPITYMESARISSSRGMDTQQVAFQVKMSLVFLRKPWKLKRGTPCGNTFPGFTALVPAQFQPAVFLCTTVSVLQVLVIPIPAMKCWIPKQKNSTISRLMCNKVRKTSRHRQMPQSPILLKQRVYFLAYPVSDVPTDWNGFKSSDNTAQKSRQPSLNHPH